VETNEMITSANDRMDKAVNVIVSELKGIRTGRASTSLLDRVTVDYYGTKTPLKQLASINVPETQLITIQPWDKNSIPSIEKAILSSDIGLTPSNDGNIIRLSIPLLTEERRKELVKVVHNIAEEGKIAVRNIRRDINDHLKKEKDDGNISEDEYYRYHDQIQEKTNGHISKIDEYKDVKEKEIMEV
jgi:ribosome recycling factor